MMLKSKDLIKKFVSLILVMLICASFFSVFADELSSQEEIDTSNFEEVSDLEQEFLYFSNQRNINLSLNAKGATIDIEKDIFTSSGNYLATCDEIINKFKSFGLDTIFIKTIDSNKKSFFNVDGIVKSDFINQSQEDILNYITQKAKDNGLFIIYIVDVLTVFHEDIGKNPDYINNTIIDICAKNMNSIVSKYKPDGVVFDNYYNLLTNYSYGAYLNNGNGIGFQNYMNEISLSLISSLSYVIKSTDYSIAIGLLCDNVYENYINDENDKIQSDFTLKDNANLPIEQIVKGGYIDFVTVKTSSTVNSNISYSKASQWWSNLISQSSCLLYMLHFNDNLGKADGYSSPDEIIKEIIKSKEQQVYNGSIFNSYSALIQNYKNSTDALIKYFNEQTDNDLIFKDLYMTRPSKLSFVTYENTVSFTGTSDPNFDLVVNGEKVEVAPDTGNFQLTFELKSGENKFNFEHKSTQMTYTITKKTRVIKSISPTGSVAGDGGMKIAISANAYSGANVWAKIAGSTVKLSMRDDITEEERESIYRDYYGYYTLPQGKDSDINLGKIIVYASYDGNNEQMTGASVIVNKKEIEGTDEIIQGSTEVFDPSSGNDSSTDNSDKIPEFQPVSPPASKLVKITANEAETFPTTILDDDSVPTNYPYPQGAYDYTNGDVLSYSWNGKLYTYYNLKSNRRLYIKDLQIVNDDNMLKNVVNNYATTISVEDSGKATTVSFNLKYKISPILSLTNLNFTGDYTINSFNPNELVIDLPYVNATNGINFKENPMFSNATLSQIIDKGIVKTRISLKLKNGKSFSGASSYFDGNGRLIISVRNPMKSLSGVRVVLSQGHGAGDTGANGFNGINEVDLNNKMTSLVAAYLKQEGAEVIIIPPTVGDSSAGLIQKMDEARAKNPDIFLCLHHNSAAATNATGVETYYFSPFTQPMANSINNELANYYKNTMYGNGSSKYNRGDKFSWRYMTRDMTFPAVLIEYGFVSNPIEFDKLIKENNQQGLAKATVEGIKKYLANM